MLPAVVACLACPLCGASLSTVDATLRCAHGHSFDLARQGYVSLRTGSGGPAGDDAAMVAARAAFLSAGHYAPLTAALVAAAVASSVDPVGVASSVDPAAVASSVDPAGVASSVDPVGVASSVDPADPGAAVGPGRDGEPVPLPPARLEAPPARLEAPPARLEGLPARREAAGGGSAVLDVGAGTGWHLAAVVDAAPGSYGVALDVSRYAARRAARVHPRVGAVVADAWAGLPVRTGSIDVVLDVFSPRNGPETARVLRPGGLLVVVTPGPDHLTGLVDAVGGLQVDAAKDIRLAAALEPHLRPLDRTEHRWELTLSHAEAVHAVAMGPSARHLADLSAAVAALPDPVRATASIVVNRYRRD